MTTLEQVAATIGSGVKKSAHALALPKMEKQRSLAKTIVFTLFMSAGMSSLVSLCNYVMHTGAAANAAEWFFQFIKLWPVAFLMSSTVSDYLVKKFMMPFFAPRISWTPLKKNLYSLCKVVTMAPLMSAVALLITMGAPGSASEFFFLWLFALPLSLGLALVLNLFLVGPIARKVYALVFREPF